MNITVNKNSPPDSNIIIRKAKGKSAADICFKAESSRDDLLKFEEYIEEVYHVLDHEDEFGVWLAGFPYCVVSPRARDHILPAGKARGEKTRDCRQCRYDGWCSGFPRGYFEKFSRDELCPVPDRPIEVMVEIEPNCNFNCRFCYNHDSFARQGRRSIKGFSTSYVKKVIDGASEAKIPVFRFTGGEPLLRPDIFELMAYAKSRGLEVRLNTNCSLVGPGNIKKFRNIVDNVLIPVESYSKSREALVTGYKNSLQKKSDAIVLFKAIGVPVVRIGTVATKENIADFRKLAQFILAKPADEWELYRPISNGKNRNR